MSVSLFINRNARKSNPTPTKTICFAPFLTASNINSSIFFVRAARHGVGLDLGNKPVLVFPIDQVLHCVGGSVHGFTLLSLFSGSSTCSRSASATRSAERKLYSLFL